MSPATARLPVLPEDRFFLLFEGIGPPVTALWGLLMEDVELDRARFEEAAARVLERHPKAASHLVRRSRSNLAWEPLADAARKVCVFHEPSEAPTGPEPSLDSLVAIMNAPMDPEVGPLLQLHWLPHGSGLATLGFRFHHALGDGHGSLVLLQDLFDFYNGVPPDREPPDYAAPAEPIVGGSRWAKLRLFLRFLAFHFRRARATRFAPPAKLFDLHKLPGGTIDAVARTVPREKADRYLAAARAAGATFNDLLLAAHGLAIERWLSEQGLGCGTLRIMVNQSLRHKDRQYGCMENRSAAFPIWITPDDRISGRGLLERIHRQAQECHQLRVAEAVALLGALLRLPFGLARRLVLPAATRPRVSDSLVLSNMGRLPDSEPGAGRFHFGSGRVVAAFPFVRPPDGVGALSFALTLGGRLCLTWCFLTALLDRARIKRLLFLIEETLDMLSA
jgi:condensation domain-containing protein